MQIAIEKKKLLKKLKTTLKNIEDHNENIQQRLNHFQRLEHDPVYRFMNSDYSCVQRNYNSCLTYLMINRSVNRSTRMMCLSQFVDSSYYEEKIRFLENTKETIVYIDEDEYKNIFGRK